MKTSQLLLSAAVTGIIAGSAAMATMAPADAAEKHVKCYNSCTGRGACKTATHACKGQNGCEGDGKVVMISADECAKEGGLLKKPRTPAYPMPAPAAKPSSGS